MLVRLKDKGKIVIRIAISAILLSFIIYAIGLEKIKDVISHTTLWLFIVAILVENIGVAISAKKWQILLKSKDVKITYSDAISYYYIGSFFNTMMPSSVGGDVIKAYKLGKKTNNIEAFSSVVMDRVTGLIAVVLIALFAIATSYEMLPQIAITLAFILILCFLVFLLMLFKTNFFEKVVKKLFSRWDKPKRFLHDIISSVKSYRDKKTLYAAMSISLLFHIILILNNYVLSLALNLKINITYFFIFIPIAEILVALPISIQGFGVRESSYALLFSSIGVSYAAAFSLGFLNQLVKVITSIVGGIVYVIKK